MVMFDVVEEILLRLSPVKDLLRCKSVCKSWYSLISSPSFIKTHEKFICNKDHKNLKQLGNRRIAMSRIYTITNALYIEGSSNGLVCISSFDNRLFLTNPSTQGFRVLHKPQIPKDAWHARCYGFGYDSSTDDYKLVMVIDQGCDGTLVQILSLKSNVWKLFGHVNYRFHKSEPGILFNGALHWFWFDADYTKNKVYIVAFDLAKEEFMEIPQPDDTSYVCSWRSKLGIIEDRLCIFHTHDDGRPFSIWVMKNYNVKPFWELLPCDYEMKDNVVHYMNMITDCDHRRKLTFFCDDNIHLSRDAIYIRSPIFVQTLVSPYSNNGKSSHANNKNWGVKDNRDIEEVNLEDGATERKKRKGSRNGKKNGSKVKREIDEIREGGKKKRKRNTNKSNN